MAKVKNNVGIATLKGKNPGGTNGTSSSGLTRKRRGKEEIKSGLLNSDPTRDYQATRYSYYGEMFVQNLPPWRIWTGRMMLSSDPIVNFSMNIRNAALMAAEVIVKAKNPQAQKWVQEQWDYLWNHHRPQLVSAKRFGFAPLQTEWKMKNGLLCIDGVKDFQPEDCRALETTGSKLIGLRVKGAPLYFPQGLWLKFGGEFGVPYGTGCLRRSYPAWYEKWMDHGAKRLLQLRMVKDAYIGDIFWYPPDMLVEIPDGVGGSTKMSYRDLVREMGENRLSGGMLSMPMKYDSQGNKLTDYTPPQNVGGITHIFDWVDHCDENILRGADIPIEVVKASETGSGYSGRSVPFLVMLSVCTQELTEIVHAVNEQVLRPVAWLNWGGEPEYTIEPRSLVESFSQDTSGSPMGGEAVGGSSPQQQQVPGQSIQQSEQFSEEPHKFSSTQFNMPGELAFEIRQLGERIPDSDLAGDGREKESHITIKYGIHSDDEKEVRRIVQSLAPVAIQIGKCSVFKADEKDVQRGGDCYDVVKLEIESQALHDLNKAITKGTECTDTFPKFVPHCTIAYVKPGLGEFYAKRLNDLQGKVAVFDRLIFSNKLREHTPILLTGKAQFNESTSFQKELGGEVDSDGGIPSNGGNFQFNEVKFIRHPSGNHSTHDGKHHIIKLDKSENLYNPKRHAWSTRHNDIPDGGDVFDTVDQAKEYIKGLYHSQHEEVEQFEESEAIKKLRQFIQKGMAYKIDLALKKIQTLKESSLDTKTLAGQIELEIMALRPYLTSQLAISGLSAHLKGVAEVFDSLPKLFIPPTKPKDSPANAIGAIPTASVINSELGGHVELGPLNEALSRLEASPVASSLNYLETAKKIHAGAFAITTELTNDAVGKVKESLYETMREGKTKEEFIDDVNTKLGTGTLSENHIETILRTNQSSLLSDGKLAAVKHPMVSDAFPFASIHATKDARVRPEHFALESLGLNGTNIYYVSDPTFKKFRSPWGFSCRCSWSATTVEQAARKGVKQAQQWLEAAKGMAKVRGGNYNQYFGETKPPEFEFVAPPPFEPDPAFKRDE